ncbi:hypothetical protein HFO61_33610 [Rhizobium leguminosarum]|nr:hypothetical protein [Rhizobium leguminosarum]
MASRVLSNVGAVQRQRRDPGREDREMLAELALLLKVSVEDYLGAAPSLSLLKGQQSNSILLKVLTAFQ